MLTKTIDSGKICIYRVKQDEVTDKLKIALFAGLHLFQLHEESDFFLYSVSFM